MNEELFSRKSTHSQPVKVIKDFSYKSQQQNFTAAGSNKQVSFFRNRLLHAIYMDEEISQIQYKIKLDKKQFEECDSGIQQLKKKIQIQRQQRLQIQNQIHQKQIKLNQLQKRFFKGQQTLNQLNETNDSPETQLHLNKFSQELDLVKLEILKLRGHLQTKRIQLKEADEQVMSTLQFIRSQTTRRSYINYQIHQLNTSLQKVRLKKNVPNYQHSKFRVV